MTNTTEYGNDACDAFAHPDGRHSRAAADIARGTMRMLSAMGLAPALELTLPNYRRADIVAIGAKGEVWIVEIKSSIADFQADAKWSEYLGFCDRFFFAVDGGFPVEILPDEAGLIIADRYGAAIMRDAPDVRIPAARRRAVTLDFARVAAARLHRLLDPAGGHDQAG